MAMFNNNRSQSESVGYVMSSQQLNELWHYDMWLAHNLLDLPLRTCLAVPMDWPEPFHAMAQNEFNTLKDEIRRMWIVAALHFTSKKGPFGWGLFFGQSEHHVIPFVGNKDLVMGWLAKCPASETCPSIHKYLRSPCEIVNGVALYLGGPISCANHERISRVKCLRCIASFGPRKNKVAVSKAPNRTLGAGMEVLWDYNLGFCSKNDASFHSQRERQLDDCCSEEEGIGVYTAFPMAADSAAHLSSQGSATKRMISGNGPCRTDFTAPSYRECTYCGENLASGQKNGPKENVKRHWALKHAAHLCTEMGASPADANNLVSPKEFMLHLDTIDNVYNSLRRHGYRIIPACHYLHISGASLLRPDATSAAKDMVFQQFQQEARRMFKNYQVIYLTGISIPVKYSDLLRKEPTSNYSDVCWLQNRPSSSNFSLSEYKLSNQEKEDHEKNIKIAFLNAVVAWQNN